MIRKRIDGDYLRSILFGFEDGLVSTTGVVIGVSAGSLDRQFVILAALVTVAVEALSMGAGEFLSDEAVHELEPKNHHDKPLLAAALMFFAYITAGLVPILPVLLFPLTTAMSVSILGAFVSLYILGFIKGKIVKVSSTRSGLETLLVGGIATVLGLIVGIALRV